MPRPTHHTPAVPIQQVPVVPLDRWASEVLPRLPADLDAHAARHKALCRKRAFASASELLRGLLGYVLIATSLTSLGVWAVLIDLADVSGPAWRKRLRAANAWLGWLLSELIAAPPTTSAVPDAPGRILLVDATYLALPGPTGSCWRVHTAYDLGAGRLADVTVTDQHGAEAFAHYALQPGDLVVADSGYGYRQHLVTLSASAVQVLVRIHPPTCPIETADGQRIDLLAWLQHGARLPRSLTGWCRYRRQRVAVRLLAVPLAEDATRRAHRHAKTKGRKRKRPVQPATLVYASWVVLVTTLDAERWSDAQVQQLYRARWQVELVYKRMKQLLKLGTVRSKDPVLVEVTIRLWLIAWALHEREGCQIRAQLAAAQEVVAHDAPQVEPAMLPVSSWGLTQLVLELVRQQVRGDWSRARLDACLPRLRRFLCPSPRRRQQQETGIRAWIAQHWAAEPARPHQEGV